ncbi:MAG: hypothetical protein M3004_09480 [Bacteroidota bacterium]|nr:hypothetical protein [Bacteroidota bacterium]
MEHTITSEKNISIEHSSTIRFFAHIFSYIFHPLFIPLYVIYYLVFINPDFFVGISDKEKTWVLLRVTLNMIFFPALTVLLLKGVGFVESVFLKTQRDRIIPYMAAGIFFFWMYLVFHNQPELPIILPSFVFGVFLTSSVGLLGNIYFKISMHAMGCGGMFGLMLIILKAGSSSSITLPLAIVILITGVVCTSRMIVSDHSQKDIYMGLLLGFLCQYIAAAIIL